MQVVVFSLQVLAGCDVDTSRCVNKSSWCEWRTRMCRPWTMHPSFTSNHAECGLEYRTQHHHPVPLMMRSVKLCSCGRNCWCQPLFRCRCLQLLSCTLLPLQTQWHHSHWQGSEVLHFFHMVPVSGFNSRSPWRHKPMNTGTGLVVICKSTSLHGNFWRSSLLLFALNLICPVAVALLRANREQTTLQPMQLQPKVCR